MAIFMSRTCFRDGRALYTNHVQSGDGFSIPIKLSQKLKEEKPLNSCNIKCAKHYWKGHEYTGLFGMYGG